MSVAWMSIESVPAIGLLVPPTAKLGSVLSDDLQGDGGEVGAGGAGGRLLASADGAGQAEPDPVAEVGGRERSA